MDDAEDILFSLVVCTRDRATSLKRMLDSVVAAKKPSRSWEIIIVDNGSSDRTQDVIRKYVNRLPIHSVIAPLPGLSNARNVGVGESRGKFIVWTDDDVTIDSDFLCAYAERFSSDTENVVFGGFARPVYEQPTKSWLLKNEQELTALLAIRDSTHRRCLERDYLPFGLNFAVRADVQRSFLYDPSLGVAPGRRRGGEEIAVISSILESGYGGVWVWNAKVQHHIPLVRQRARYVWSYYRASGFDWPPFKVGYGPLGTMQIAALAFRELLKITFKISFGFGRWVTNLRDLAAVAGMYDRRRSGT